MSISLSALLATIASISPLLTFAALWQMKEWRRDRLREHLRSEGILRQLLGIYRPVVVACMGVLLFTKIIDLGIWVYATLAALLAIAGLQILLRRHPKPKWTKKAIVLCATALLLTFLTAVHTYSAALPILPLLQPFFLIIAGLLWAPIDRSLKQSIMKKAGHLRADRKDLIVIGITGSVGKTTTKELLTHVLADRNLLSTPEHVNSDMGVAQWMLHSLPRNPDAEILIVEMGAYRIGEIALLCKIAQPTMGILTFIGNQHIGLFGSQEALCRAKGELITSLPQDGYAFLNADSELCAKMKEDAPCTVIAVGTGGEADLEAFDIEETSHGISFRASDTTYFVPLHGTHNVTNVLLTIAVAQKLGISAEEIVAKLKTFRPAKHTFSMRTAGSVTIIDDTHNASTASFKAAIAWARSQPVEHKVLLTSGLIELGEEQERAHREMGTLSAKIFDRVIFLNRRSARSFAEGFGKEAEMKSKHTPKVENDSLLVCIGRMPQSVISSLLP